MSINFKANLLKSEFDNFSKLVHVVLHGLFLLIICSYCACRNDNECVDVDYGRQYLSEASYASFAYNGGETLFFKDSNGNEMKFRLIPEIPVYPHYRIYEQEVIEGSCAGKMKVKTEGQSLGVNIICDSLDYSIFYFHSVSSILQGTSPIYFDVMYADAFKFIASGNPNNYYVPLTALLDLRGNDALLDTIKERHEYTESITLNGKAFDKVYYNILPNGSAIYFSYAMGFVAFKDGNNPLWVLDRIE